MAKVISCERQGSTHVHLRTDNNSGVSLAGELIGWGPCGVVLKNGSTYEVRNGSGGYVARLSASEWSTKQWDYHSDYCSR